jgi:hypothetical protein
MFKINEAIRASIKTYIFSKLMFIFIKKILQVLIIKYKIIDDQIKKQIQKKFQTLKQSSFKNQIEIVITNWKNLRSRILILNIKNFFDFETMFVEKFLIADRKWTSTFCVNWIMQKKTIEKNVHFEETIREFKNIVKKRLKIVEHVNVVIFQNQSQSQSKKSTLSICSDHHENNDKTRQCIYDCMHDWNKCDHILKSIKSSNWKCNLQKKKWAKKTIKKQSLIFFQDQESDEYWHFKRNQIRRLQKWQERKKWQKIRQ